MSRYIEEVDETPFTPEELEKRVRYYRLNAKRRRDKDIRQARLTIDGPEDVPRLIATIRALQKEAHNAPQTE